MFVEDKSKFVEVADPLAMARKNRGELIALLRDSDRWPDGFKWDYSKCGTCAIGILVATSAVKPYCGPSMGYYGWEAFVEGSLAWDVSSGEANVVAAHVGLDPMRAAEIFLNARIEIGIHGNARVLPEHVAALLEAAPYVI